MSPRRSPLPPPSPLIPASIAKWCWLLYVVLSAALAYCARDAGPLVAYQWHIGFGCAILGAVLGVSTPPMLGGKSVVMLTGCLVLASPMYASAAPRQATLTEWASGQALAQTDVQPSPFALGVAFGVSLDGSLLQLAVGSVALARLPWGDRTVILGVVLGPSEALIPVLTGPKLSTGVLAGVELTTDPRFRFDLDVAYIITDVGRTGALLFSFTPL